VGAERKGAKGQANSKPMGKNEGLVRGEVKKRKLWRGRLEIPALRPTECRDEGRLREGGKPWLERGEVKGVTRSRQGREIQ